MGCLHGLSEPDAINMFASGWDHLRAVQIGDTSQGRALCLDRAFPFSGLRGSQVQSGRRTAGDSGPEL